MSAVQTFLFVGFGDSARAEPSREVTSLNTHELFWFRRAKLILSTERYGGYRRFPCFSHLNGDWSMDKEHIKGAADKAKGAVKDTVGKMTGDTKMQAEGKIDKAKGTAHNVAGDVKDAARDATDND
jgi:uncharacterized protein YjbJ (UPF0337 family)